MLIPALLAGLAPRAVSAAEPEDAIALYEEGRRALENGEFSAAAERFEQAYEALPREELERRAAVLFELVEARRAAFTEDGRPSHLCKAEETIARFLEDNAELRGSRRSRDARKAAELRDALVDELMTIKADNPGFSCDAAPEPEPEPEPEPAPEEAEPAAEPEPLRPREPTQVVRLRDPKVASGVALIGAGALLLGSAGAGLALGAHAEFEGEWLLKSRPDLASTSPEAQRLDEIGRSANLLTIVGGSLGVAALGTGIALYILGKRQQATPASEVALTPALSTTDVGANLRVRF
ncbi:MAG: hypothetical protein R3A79_15140 [Nannocystaceae bacterium]